MQSKAGTLEQGAQDNTACQRPAAVVELTYVTVTGTAVIHTCNLRPFSVSASSFLIATLAGFCHLRRCIPTSAYGYGHKVKTVT